MLIEKGTFKLTSRMKTESNNGKTEKENDKQQCTNNNRKELSNMSPLKIT